MSQDATASDDGLIDLDDMSLRDLDDLGDTVLARELRKVLASSAAPTEAIARFQSKAPRRPSPGSAPERRGAGTDRQ